MRARRPNKSSVNGSDIAGLVLVSNFINKSFKARSSLFKDRTRPLTKVSCFSTRETRIKCCSELRVVGSVEVCIEPILYSEVSVFVGKSEVSRVNQVRVASNK